MVAINVKIGTLAFSSGIRPGATKAHSWYKQKGELNTIPAHKLTLKEIEKASGRPV
jgi:hypothetical protein